MAAIGALSFSACGNYLACCSPDGRLRIWETATGIVKHEYTPSRHLSATSSCVTWCPVRRNSGSTPKRKKLKTIRSLDLLAMGTTSGSILLYSLSKGELQSEMAGGHDGHVTSICWSTDTESIFSTSYDGYIVEWNVQSGEVKRKWLGVKKGAGISAACLSPDGTTLLIGTKRIVWWDLETQTVLQKFTGHATDIQQILFISYPDSPVEGSYIITSAIGDRLINAWQLMRKSHQKNSLASFSLPEEPVHLNVLQPTDSDKTMLLAAVTKSGSVHVFEHQLNGPLKKPLKPAVTVTVASSTVENHETPKPIPIVATRLCQDLSRHLVLAYGSFLRLCLERLPYSNSEREVCLAREDPSRFSTHVEGTSNKIKTPLTRGSVKHLVPHHMDPSGPSDSVSKSLQKRKGSANNELPMEERLSVLTIEQPSGAEPPRISNLAQLLLQGLQSKDPKILTNVLTKDDDDIIQNTVSRLPVQTVIPVLKELQNRLYTNRVANLKWIRCILTVHASYLTTCPDVDGILGPLYQMFDAKSQLFEKMSKLRGRMELIWSQISSRTTESKQIPTAALLEYQDDSSDAEELLDDILPSHSESEDNWNVSEDDDGDDSNEAIDIDNDNGEDHAGDKEEEMDLGNGLRNESEDNYSSDSG